MASPVKLSMVPTLRIQEVADWDWMRIFLMDRGIPEHLIDVSLRADAHVLLAQSSCLACEIAMFLKEDGCQSIAKRRSSRFKDANLPAALIAEPSGASSCARQPPPGRAGRRR